MFHIGIETFLIIAKTRNISRAAEQLNLAQSTVSKRLQLLEQDLNVALIERGQGTKSLRLTPAGEKFIHIAQRWATLQAEAMQLQLGGSQMTLSIGTLNSLSYTLFRPLFRSLAQHEPRLKLNIVTSHSPNLYDLIEQLEVDVGFTGLERKHPSIITESLVTDPLVALRIASPSHEESGFVHPCELDPNFELFFPAGLSYQKWHDQWWSPLSPYRIHLDNLELIFSFLYDEKQWIIVPLSVAKTFKSRGNFTISKLLENPPDRVIYRITHKHPLPSMVESLKVLDHYLKIYFAPSQ